MLTEIVPIDMNSMVDWPDPQSRWWWCGIGYPPHNRFPSTDSGTTLSFRRRQPPAFTIPEVKKV
jgi:hypothetical protein